MSHHCQKMFAEDISCIIIVSFDSICCLIPIVIAQTGVNYATGLGSCPSQMKCQGMDFNQNVLLPVIRERERQGWPAGIGRLRGWYLIFGGTSAMFYSEAKKKTDHFFDRNGAGTSDVDIAIVYDWELTADWMSPQLATQAGMMGNEKPQSRFNRIQFGWFQTQKRLRPNWEPFQDKWAAKYEAQLLGLCFFKGSLDKVNLSRDLASCEPPAAQETSKS